VSDKAPRTPAIWHDHQVDVVVQRISTWWTKESRGAPAATARNTAPIAFELPPDFAFGLHDIVMREATGFEPQSHTGELADAELAEACPSRSSAGRCTSGRRSGIPGASSSGTGGRPP
jgi:hypothetical protein